MPLTALTGSRVRERRLALGLRQADVARAAGISASYLNLIEHNRRRIAGEGLERLAQALGVTMADLAEGGEGALTVRLRAAAQAEPAAETARLEEFIGRFPGWAGLTAALQARVEGLEQAVAALSDRIAHDPHLSLALHEVISAVSSVRSTSAILAETEDIEPEWRARFHANLHADSERLARGAEALVAYLDGSEQEPARGAATPEAEFDAWLEARGWRLPQVETGSDAEDELAGLSSAVARDLARAYLAQAQGDARALPQAEFAAALQRLGPEPLLLAAEFGVAVLPVMRRIALLSGPDVGLVICDGAGAPLFRKPVEGFQPPRLGAGCALWPLFAALARPMQPIETRIEMAGRNGRRFLARAYAEAEHPGGFGGVEVRRAGMLLLPAPGAGAPPLRVGATCRICPEQACPARREPSILSDAAEVRG